MLDVILFFSSSSVHFTDMINCIIFYFCFISGAVCAAEWTQSHVVQLWTYSIRLLTYGTCKVTASTTWCMKLNTLGEDKEMGRGWEGDGKGKGKGRGWRERVERMRVREGKKEGDHESEYRFAMWIENFLTGQHVDHHVDI